LALSNWLNYAYGSATSDSRLVQGYTAFNTSVPGVRQQIVAYRQRLGVSPMDAARTVFVIWAGANDYLFNRSVSPHDVVDSLMRAVDDLVQLGARHFLVMNQPPVNKQPLLVAANLSEAYGPLVAAHNTRLARAINTSSTSNSSGGVSVRLVDLHRLIDAVLGNLSVYGMNSSGRCWDTSNGTVVQLCTTPDTYLFIDDYHFTSRAHQLIAEHVRSLLVGSHAPILAPLAWPLLALVLSLAAFV
jgi:phospholipase/lecithinase/hemolysin